MKKEKKKRATTTKKSVQEQSAESVKVPWYIEMFSRPGVESIVVVIIAAMLFRTFEAEGYVIPTGSMAPTLRGLHKDVECPKCGIDYQVGASVEVQAARGRTIQGTCPNCRYRMQFDPNSMHHAAFSGDRIYVNKLAFQLREPRRYEPIVFKYPGNPKQNYIKRLVALPNEIARIYQGDVFVRTPDVEEFQITRKRPSTLLAMLQLIYDTRYVPDEFIQQGYPDRWYDPQHASSAWSSSANRQEYQLLASASGNQPRWLHYRHLTASDGDWRKLERGAWTGHAQPSLVTDFYAYNAGVYGRDGPSPSGFHWVGDLCIECDVEIRSTDGELLFDLVEGGSHHVCRIDIATGIAELTIDPDRGTFVVGEAQSLTAATAISGKGKHAVRFANIDDQLLLWIDGHRVRFTESDEQLDGAYSVARRDRVVPRWSREDAGDLEPVRIGGRAADLVVSDLRLLRDVYYIASNMTVSGLSDYEFPIRPHTEFYRHLQQLFATPQDWALTPYFAARRHVDFVLGPDDYFPLGDNSPESKDARIWHHGSPAHLPRFVKRDMLVGSPFVIFWPHSWPVGAPFIRIPNFGRFNVIR